MTSVAATAAQDLRQPFLSLAGIRKAYPGVVALSDFSMTVSPGEVIGLVGENGAGKSTLMKILGGVAAPDAGTITIDGVERSSLSVAESMKAGIAFVHQELNLFDNLDVAANIFIGREPRRGGFLNLVDNDRMHAMAAPLLQRLGAGFGPSTPLADLSLAQRQMVEIAKALSMNARLVILDEPTSSLPISETERLLETIEALRGEGIAVIFISHRLHEIQRAVGRVVVLRDGVLVGNLDRGEITHDRMVKLMIGRDLKAQIGTHEAKAGAVVLAAKGIRTEAYPHHELDISLRSGEILGLAGLVSAGRTELARVLFGIDAPLAGSITLNGAAVRLLSATQAIQRGVFLVPEDRKVAGVLLDLPIAENITLPNLGAHATGLLVSRRKEVVTAERERQRLSIRAPSVMTRTGSLSGGNQQKVVLAKWLAMSPKVMIFDEPTRGIDIGAKSEIYRLMRGLADNGVAVLMISSDMEEVIGVSDRIAVMHEGLISGTLDKKDFSQENILLLAVGRSIDPEATPMQGRME